MTAAPVQFRAEPADTAPAPVQTRAEPAAAAAPRAADVIAAERARAVAEAETLHARSTAGTNPLAAEEETRLDSLLAEIDRLDGELKTARRSERLQQQRAAVAEPTRPAPTFAPAPAPAAGRQGADAQAEGLAVWLRSFSGAAEPDAQAHYRARQAGFNIGSNTAAIPTTFPTLNREKRRALSTGGTGTGAEFVQTSYSNSIAEYITYFSPIVGMVDSETTGDANRRDYFKVDDTALISTEITASSGTELNPTIPDVDITTGVVQIACKDITSGTHKITQQALRDSSVNLVPKVTQAIGNSHARKLERDIILGTGDGVTDVQGIIAAGTRYGSAVDAFTPELFEALYFSVPLQYRSGCIWLFSDTSMAKAVSKLKLTTGASLFGKTAADGAEIQTLFGRPVYVSSYMPAYGANAKCVTFFHPMFYMLRLVAGQSLTVLREKYFPHVGYVGGMAFGGAWRGPSSCNKYLQLDASPDSGS